MIVTLLHRPHITLPAPTTMPPTDADVGGLASVSLVMFPRAGWRQTTLTRASIAWLTGIIDSPLFACSRRSPIHAPLRWVMSMSTPGYPKIPRSTSHWVSLLLLSLAFHCVLKFICLLCVHLISLQEYYYIVPVHAGQSCARCSCGVKKIKITRASTCLGAKQVSLRLTNEHNIRHSSSVI